MVVPAPSMDALLRNASAPRRGRLVQVDVLRGIAIVLVLFRHATISSEEAGSLKPLVLHLYYFSACGIDLFFVLSGFLIGGLLFKEVRTTGGIDVRRFLIRRGLRIWPPYLAFIAFVFVRLCRRKTYTPASAFRAIVPNLLHVQNYFGSPRGITWSLAVQEHFYLALPLFLLVAFKWRRRRHVIAAVPAAAAVLVVVCTTLRVLLNWNRPYNMWTHATPTHLRLDGLFVGVLVAYLYHFHPQPLARLARRRAALALAGCAMIAPTFFLDEGSVPYTWTLGYSLLYLGFACILVVTIHSPSGDSGGPGPAGLMKRLAAGLATIGVFTYSIYLWHYDLGALSVHNYLLPHLPHRPAELYWALGTSVYFATAIAAGIFMAKLIELPVIRLRDRLLPGRATATRGVVSSSSVLGRPLIADSPTPTRALSLEQETLWRSSPVPVADRKTE